MTIDEALALIAKHSGLDYVEMAAYADEDTVGGRGRGYDDWSIDADEGKLLYALVRALTPTHVLELGVHHGASTEHLLAAIDANGSGTLDSYDLHAVPAPKHPAWTFHEGDALTADLPAADFVFEDADHSLAGATAAFTKIKALNPRIVVTHDYAMTTAHGDFHVAEAFDAVFPDGFSVTLDGCERGLGVWVNPTPAEAPKAPATRTRKPRTNRSKKS